VCLLLLVFVYGFDLVNAGTLDKNRIYSESLLIYLGSLAALLSCSGAATGWR